MITKNELIFVDQQKAARILSDGGLVAVPTETVYGLAANGVNTKAIARIFEVKKRPFFDPLILHFASIDRISECVESLPKIAIDLLERFSPGPLTLVLPKKKVIPDLATAGMNSVALRIPAHPMTLELLKNLDFPLAAPSANLFGQTSPTRPSHVIDQLGDAIDGIIDGGPCEVGVESTILDLTKTEPIILRWGGLSQEDIESFLGRRLKTQTSSSKPSAPGMLESHYSPGVTVRLVSQKEKETLIVDPKAAFLCFDKFNSCLPTERQFILSQKADLKQAACRLFEGLRELGNLNPSVIYSELVPDIGLGKAINDRLLRASAS